MHPSDPDAPKLDIQDFAMISRMCRVEAVPGAGLNGAGFGLLAYFTLSSKHFDHRTRAIGTTLVFIGAAYYKSISLQDRCRIVRSHQLFESRVDAMKEAERVKREAGNSVS